MIGKRKLCIALAIATICLADAKPSQAGFVIQGGTETATISLISNFMQGYDFISNMNQSLTALSFWDEGSNGLPAAFRVGLWDTATQTLLASAVIDSTDPLDTSVTIANGQYRFESLSSAVALTSGKTYTLAFQTGSGGISSTDSLFLNYPTMSFDPNVTVANQNRAIAGTGLVFPTNNFTAGNSFIANVNALLSLTAPNVVPAPAGLVLGLFGMGSFGIGGLIRRRLASKSTAA